MLLFDAMVNSFIYFPTALSMTGHSSKSNGGTHGSQEALKKATETLAGEANLPKNRFTPQHLPYITLPGPFIAGTFEKMLRTYAPDDPDLRIDWRAFVREAATQVSSQPADIRDEAREWVHECAEIVGVPKDELNFTEASPYERVQGALNDPYGTIHFIEIDGDEIGLSGLVDAIRIANNTVPMRQFTIAVQPKLEKNARTPYTRLKRVINRKLQQLLGS